MADRLELRDVKNRAKDIIKYLKPFADVKKSDAKRLEKLGKGLSKLPEDSLIIEAVSDLRSSTEQFINIAQKEMSEEFGRNITAFIHECKDQGLDYRETNNAWRIGFVEMELKKATAQIRFLYNREQVEPAKGWQPVSSLDGIRKGYSAAVKKLESFRISDQLLMDAVWDAYSCLSEMRKKNGVRRPFMVPINDFQYEFRIALFRQQLTQKNPGKQVKYEKFPDWAFLYNLDRYRKISKNLPDTQRISFTTGSQAEQAKRGGCVLGGLDPKQNYKTFCYLERLKKEN